MFKSVNWISNNNTDIKKVKKTLHFHSPHDEHQSSGPRPINLSIIYLELYKDTFKNLIRTNKFKLSFRGLYSLPFKKTTHKNE